MFIGQLLVLCSVPHPEDNLREILRVLKPRKACFYRTRDCQEGTSSRIFRNLIQPVCSLVGDGYHPNLVTWDILSQAGFAHLEIEYYHIPGGGPTGPRRNRTESWVTLTPPRGKDARRGSRRTIACRGCVAGSVGSG